MPDTTLSSACAISVAVTSPSRTRTIAPRYHHGPPRASVFRWHPSGGSHGRCEPAEREAIRERTRDALRHKRTQRDRVGNIAFGFPPNGVHAEHDPTEQAMPAELRRLRAAGTS